MLPKKGDRKLLVVALALTYAFVLALLQRLTPEMATVVSICVPAFVAGNSFEHHVETRIAPPPQ